MKNLALLLVLFIIPFSGKTQTDSLLWDYELEDPGYHFFDSIKDAWLANDFQEIMKNNHLKLSCAKCHAIYINFVFEIDSLGTLADYQVVKGYICGEEPGNKLVEMFLKRFREMVFPECFYRKKFKVRLGNALKC
ncbi:MAG: hypothetical protein KKA07_07835 [Bacteroidetes bacterium]|nr:hypothetical protein [Bacteroidota bacterium]MBU1718973.1 hypothetical protein [Bacteroidota bacterium]